MCNHQVPIRLTGHCQVSPECVCHLRRKNISITPFRFNVLFHHDPSTVISRRRNDRVVNVRMLPYGNLIDDTFDVFLKTNPRWWHSCQVHIFKGQVSYHFHHLCQGAFCSEIYPHLLSEIIGCTLGRQSPLTGGTSHQKHPSIHRVSRR